MDYDKRVYSELAIMVLENDIDYLCKRYYVNGYELEDLKQECRLRLWQQLKKFDPDRGIMLRTWASQVIRNHIKNLLRNSQREIRRANCSVVYILVEELLSENGRYEIQEEN